jgi:hypothetical protein
MTQTNAQIYSDQYDQVSKQQDALQDAYKSTLDKLDTENSSQGMITIMTSTLILVSMWQESMMMSDVVTLNALSTMQSDENSMQADENQYQEEYQSNWQYLYDEDYNQQFNLYLSEGYNPDSANNMAMSDATTYADKYAGVTDPDLISDAYGYAQDMESIANLPEFASISDDVTNQVDSIFVVNSDGSLNMSATESMWDEAVSASAQSGSGSTNTSGTDVLQDMTNAFSALSTDFSGMSSSAQNEEQYYESQDQQAQGLDQTLMKSWATELMSMVKNQITS